MRISQTNAIAMLALVAAFLVPYGGTSAAILMAGGAAIALLLLPLRNHPTAILFVWTAVVAVSPPWLSFHLFGYRVPVAAVISVAVVIITRGRTSLSWNIADTFVAVLAAISIIASAGFQTPIHIMTQVLLEWVTCYAAGRWMLHGADFRLVGNRLGGVVGWLAVLQALIQFNVANMFVFASGVSGNLWMPLQERGGQIRAELTFGHSIALGAVLTLLLPFALQRTGTLIDKLMVLGILLGVGATFSRSAMVAALVVAVFSLASSQASGATKVVGSLLIAAVTWAGISWFAETVSSSTNSVELTDSTAYREGLLDLANIVGGIGLAQGGVPAADGVTYIWDQFYSIDNGLLYLGLYVGGLAAISYLLVLVLVIRRAAANRWSPFATAVVGHIPFILTVAPITQYQNIYWMNLGAGAGAAYSKSADSTIAPYAGEDKVNRSNLMGVNGR